VNHTLKARNAATRARTEEEGGQELLRVIATLKGYLCDERYDSHPVWTGRNVRMARRVLNVRTSGHEWALVGGLRRRLEEAGLNEKCEVVDPEKWARAYRQICERENYDPSIARIEEAFGPMPEPIEEKPRPENRVDDQSNGWIKASMENKKVKFGNAQ